MKRARDPDDMRAAIAARKLTRRELAKLADCSVGTIEFVLAGRATNPDTARLIARALRRRVDDLFAVVVSSSEQAQGQQDAVA